MVHLLWLKNDLIETIGLMNDRFERFRTLFAQVLVEHYHLQDAVQAGIVDVDAIETSIEYMSEQMFSETGLTYNDVFYEYRFYWLAVNIHEMLLSRVYRAITQVLPPLIERGLRFV